MKPLRAMHAELAAHDPDLFGDTAPLEGRPVPADGQSTPARPKRPAPALEPSASTLCLTCGRQLLAGDHASWCPSKTRIRGAPRRLPADLEERFSRLLRAPTIGAIQRRRG